MVKLLDRVKQAVSGSASSTTLGAAVSGFRTFNSAGAATNDVCRYAIEDDNGAFEIGTIVINSATTGTRTVEVSSNSNNALTLTGNAVIFATLSASDFSDNAAPAFVNTIPGTLDLVTGVVSTLDGKALDDDGYPLNYSWDAFAGTSVYSPSSLPPQLSSVSINQTTGVFSLTPTSNTANGGSHSFRVRASDGVRVATATVAVDLSFLPLSGMTGLYDMNDSNSYSGSGTTWSDVSGNSGPNLTITTANVTYNSSGLGGIPSLTMDVKDNSGPIYYSGSAFTGTSGKTTVAMIFAGRTALSDTTWVMLSNATARSYSVGPQDNSAYDAIWASASNSGRPVASTTSTLYIDKVDRTAATGDTVHDDFKSSANIDKYHSVVLTDGWFQNGFYMSQNAPYNGKSPLGELRALVFYNRALSSAEVTSLHAHFAGDYTSSTMIQ